MTLIEPLPPLTEEQKRSIAEMLAHQKQGYDEYLNNRTESRTKDVLVQEAWKAARQAASEHDSAYSNRSQRGSWRNMWIALAIAGAILLFVKLLFLR